MFFSIHIFQKKKVQYLRLWKYNNLNSINICVKYYVTFQDWKLCRTIKQFSTGLLSALHISWNKWEKAPLMFPRNNVISLCITHIHFVKIFIQNPPDFLNSSSCPNAKPHLYLWIPQIIKSKIKRETPVVSQLKIKRDFQITHGLSWNFVK